MTLDPDPLTVFPDDTGPDLTDGATLSIARYLVYSACLLLVVGLVTMIRVTR